MAFEPGDVVLVPFPYRDAAAVKTRPAVVVSSSEFNQAGDLPAWLLAATKVAFIAPREVSRLHVDLRISNRHRTRARLSSRGAMKATLKHLI